MTEASSDSAKYENFGNVRFTDKSLLLVNANNRKGNAAIRGPGISGTTSTVKSGTALHVSNITTQGATVLDGFNSLTVKGWNGTNLTSADALTGIAMQNGMNAI